jgi:hypothetical protein
LENVAFQNDFVGAVDDQTVVFGANSKRSSAATHQSTSKRRSVSILLLCRSQVAFPLSKSLVVVFRRYQLSI